jgi:hypothetical protein
MSNTQKKVQLLDFKLSKNLASNLFWIYKTTFHGNWIDFAEHRQYTFWDSIKDIDWKSSAKTWNIYIKKYEEERDLNVLFLLDISKSMDFWSEKIKKSEIMEDIFYSLAFSAIQNDDNIWAIIYDENIKEIIPVSKWAQNIFRILDLIEKHKTVDTSIYGVYWNSKDMINRISTNENNKTLKVLEHINKMNIRKNLIFILTDDTNFDDENLLKLAWIENELIIVNIFDYFENNLLDENVSFWVSNQNNFWNIDLWDKKRLEQYKKNREIKLKELENKLKRNKIWYIYIDNRKNIYSELVWYFSKIN